MATTSSANPSCSSTSTGADPALHTPAQLVLRAAAAPQQKMYTPKMISSSIPHVEIEKPSDEQAIGQFVTDARSKSEPATDTASTSSSSDDGSSLASFGQAVRKDQQPPTQHRLCDPAEHFARQSHNASRRAGRPATRHRFRQQNSLFDDLLLAESERDAVQATLTIRGTQSGTATAASPEQQKMSSLKIA